MDYMIKDGELYHHGILGQKWGVRRYQNADGSLTAAGKKRSNKKKAKALEKARKAKQKKAEEAKKAKEAAEKEKKKQEEYEANKKKALESGSAKDVAQYIGKLNNQELQQVVSRLNMEQRVSELASKKEPSKIERLTKKLETANNLTDKGITAWNNLAKILNSTADTELPIISDKGKNKAKKATEKITKEVDDANQKLDKKQKKQAAKEAKKEAGDDKPLTGKVFGEGTSKRKDTSSERKRNTSDIWVDDFTDVSNDTTSAGSSYISNLLGSGSKSSISVSSLTSPRNQGYIDSGSNYIAGLLPAPKDRD